MMRRSKRERLEAKGWKFGTAQEFLGLSDEETAYVELRLRLADSLRRRRQKRKLSQTDLAKLLRGGGRSLRLHRPPDPLASRPGRLKSRSRPNDLECVVAEGKLKRRSDRSGPGTFPDQARRRGPTSDRRPPVVRLGAGSRRP